MHITSYVCIKYTRIVCVIIALQAHGMKTLAHQTYIYEFIIMAEAIFGTKYH